VYMVTKSLGPNLFNKFKRLTQNVEEKGKWLRKNVMGKKSLIV
jgi:hypothetical protein